MGLSEGSLARLTAHARLESFAAGQAILLQGEPPAFLHVALDGLVELWASHNDVATTTRLVEPGEMFILAAAATNQPYLQSARALSPTSILLIPAEALRDAIRTDALFAQEVVRRLSDAYRATIRKLKNQELRSAPERLAAWLLLMEQRQGGHGVVLMPIQKRVLAAYLGMTPEALSRALSALAKHGVQVRRREVRITDIMGLNAFAKPGPLMDDQDVPKDFASERTPAEE